MLLGGRQRDAPQGNRRAIGQDFAFDFYDAAQSSDDPGTRVEDLVRARTAGKFERSDGGDPQHGSRMCRVLVAGGCKAARLCQ